MEPIRLPWWLYAFLGVICIYILYLLYRDGKKDLELEYIRGRFDGLDDNGQPRKFISEPTPEAIKRAEEREKIQDERYLQAFQREKEIQERFEAIHIATQLRWQESRDQNEEIIDLLRKISENNQPAENKPEPKPDKKA